MQYYLLTGIILLSGPIALRKSTVELVGTAVRAVLTGHSTLKSCAPRDLVPPVFTSPEYDVFFVIATKKSSKKLILKTFDGVSV